MTDMSGVVIINTKVTCAHNTVITCYRWITITDIVHDEYRQYQYISPYHAALLIYGCFNNLTYMDT